MLRPRCAVSGRDVTAAITRAPLDSLCWPCNAVRYLIFVRAPHHISPWYRLLSECWTLLFHVPFLSCSGNIFWLCSGILIQHPSLRLPILGSTMLIENCIGKVRKFITVIDPMKHHWVACPFDQMLFYCGKLSSRHSIEACYGAVRWNRTD